MASINNQEELLALWPSLKPEEQAHYIHILKCVNDPLYWMRHGTLTIDEQDAANPYKPFPQKEYFKYISQAWDREKILFLEKSRTMLCTWFAAARITHDCMTKPATRWIIIAQDELRSLKMLEYCRTLYRQQDEALKQIWPLDRAMDKQAYNVLEWKRDSSIMALPGKDAGNKIRSEHPTGVAFDEAAFIENFHAAMGSAISTKAKKIVAITSAEPGDFREITRVAEDVDWYGEVV